MNTNTGITFPSPAAFFDAVLGPNRQQHDSHVRFWRSMVRAYGTPAKWEAAKARKLAARARLMETPEGREYLARVDAMNGDWRTV